jgi:hypothetical protein
MNLCICRASVALRSTLFDVISGTLNQIFPKKMTLPILDLPGGMNEALDGKSRFKPI